MRTKDTLLAVHMAIDKETRYLAVLLGTAFFGLYLSCAPSVQHQGWDSLWHAYRAEGPGFGLVYNPHPGADILLNLLFHIGRWIGYEGRALGFMIVANAIAGGMAMAMLFVLLRVQLNRSVLTALGMTAIVGSSSECLVIMGTADIYAITVVALLGTWMAQIHATRSASTRGWMAAGIVTGLGAGIHQMNAALGLAGFALILLQRKRSWPRHAMSYGTASAVTLCVAYWLSAWIATGDIAPFHALQWAGVNYNDTPSAYGRFFSLSGIYEGLETMGEVCLGRCWNWGGTLFRQMGLSLMAVACLMAVWGIWTKGQAERSIALTALGVFVVLGGLVIWWLPWMEKHWMLAMISGVVGIGAAGPLSVIRGHEQSARKIGRGSLVLVFAAVLAYNVKFAVLPYRRDSETYLAAVAAWLKHSNPEDLLLTVGDMNAPLAFWWNRPHTITQDFLYSGPSVTNKFAALRRVIEQRVSAGGDVLVAPAFLDYVWDDLAASSGTRKDDIRVGLGKYKWQSAFCYTNLIDGRITDVRRLVVVSSDGKRWPGTP